MTTNRLYILGVLSPNSKRKIHNSISMTNTEKKFVTDLSNCDGEWQFTLYNSFVFVCMCVFVNSSAVFCLTRSQSTWGVSEISTCGQCHFHPIGKVFNYSTWTAEDYVDQRLLGRTKRVIEGHLSRWTNLPCHSFVKWFGNIINVLHGPMQISASLEVNWIVACSL